MAEEQKEAPPQAPRKSRKLGTLIWAAAGLLLGVIVALLVFMFVLQDRLSGEVEAEVNPDAIPAEADFLELPEERVTVRTDDPNLAPPLLVYQVALLCANPATIEVVTAKMPYFKAAVLDLHQNRSESELSDPYIQESILKQVKDEVNKRLDRLAPGNEELRVLEAMHTKFAIFSI